MRLAGKVAIVTGGARGIGRAIATSLVQEGARVVVGDIDHDAATATCGPMGAAATPVWFDATDADSTFDLVAATLAEHGHLDILVNNVALTASAWHDDTTVVDTDLETWDRAMAVNLRSAFVASKAALPHLIARGGGSIVNVSSRAGLAGKPGLVAYGTSKGALMTLTRYLAVQYGRQNVRTNCVAPGPTLTEQLLENAPDVPEETLRTLPFHRIGRPEDVANLIVHLVSPEAAFVNGQIIGCDGGWSAGTAAELSQVPHRPDTPARRSR